MTGCRWRSTLPATISASRLNRFGSGRCHAVPMLSVRVSQPRPIRHIRIWPSAAHPQIQFPAVATQYRFAVLSGDRHLTNIITGVTARDSTDTVNIDTIAARSRSQVWVRFVVTCCVCTVEAHWLVSQATHAPMCWWRLMCSVSRASRRFYGNWLSTQDYTRACVFGSGDRLLSGPGWVNS